MPAHRDPGRRRSRPALSGPLALAGVVTAVLVAFGVTAALLPASLTGTAPAEPAPTVAEAGAAAGAASGAVGAGLSASTGATRDPATSTPSARPSPTATRTASPSPRRTQSPTRAPTRSTSGDPREAQVVTLVNRQRSANGCGPVQVNAKLANASRAHSVDQAEHDKMSHTGSDGSSPWQRARRAGYQQAIGENVAAGYRTAEAVMTGWMNSPDHRANILNCDAKAIGVGVAAADDGTLYWTQMFGSAL